MLNRTVSRYSTRNVIKVGPNDSISKAVGLMDEARITSILVCEASTPVGIVTSRDLPKIFESNSYDPDTPTGSIMTTPLILQHEDGTLLDALDVMINNGFRHLPVVDDHGNLTGLLSESDIMNSLGFFDPVRHQKAADMMNHAYSTLPADATLSDAMAQFAMRQNDSLLIVDGARPLGIVTERDIPRLISNDIPKDMPVEQFMSGSPITVDTEADVKDAIALMHQHRIHHVIVVNSAGETEGIISKASFLRDMNRYLIRQLVKSELLVRELQTR